MLKLNSVLIGSENPEALVAFYNQVLGPPSMQMEGFTGWDAGGGFLTVGFHSEVHGKNADPGRVIWFLETADVKAEFERIKGLGAQVVKEPYEMSDGFQLATFADPDGNYFQVSSPVTPPGG